MITADGCLESGASNRFITFIVFCSRVSVTGDQGNYLTIAATFQETVSRHSKRSINPQARRQ
jgi:hypothetical protein